jgi:hypothetical protein
MSASLHFHDINELKLADIGNNILLVSKFSVAGQLRKFQLLSVMCPHIGLF